MGLNFEELDFQKTRLGELSLRRRRDPVAGEDVFEVKLGDEYLMSSLFTAAEVELARIGLAGLEAPALDVVVGGLGLGYTARTVLEQPKVRSLKVVETLSEVIGWHERGLVPLGAALAADARCRFVEGDFFALARSPEKGFNPEIPGQKFHAILLDIDHSPRHFLHPQHSAFYEEAGLRLLSSQLHREGVFGLWSNDPPDEDFQKNLAAVFRTVKAHIIKFRNPYLNRDSEATVYSAHL